MKGCTLCEGFGFLYLMNSWFALDGYSKSRCGICSGTGKSSHRPSREYINQARDIKEEIARIIDPRSYELKDLGCRISVDCALETADAILALLSQAADAAQQSAPDVRGAGPLIWNEYEREGDIDSWDAETSFGTFYAIDCECQGFSTSHDSETFGGFHQSPEGAKAACQADYERRLNVALRAAGSDVREALIGLSGALDAYWNGDRTEHQTKAICAWQQKSLIALATPAAEVAPSLAWSASKHDEIIKRLMAQIGCPDSRSIYGAFKQFANELHALHFSTGAKRIDAGTVERCESIAEEFLVDRLGECVTRLENLKTLPKPYDLYYAIKNEGSGTGWTYTCAGIGVNELRALLDRLAPSWRTDMENAPKDTKIIVAGGTYYNSMSTFRDDLPFAGWTLAEWDVSENAWRGENSGGHDEFYYHKPTLWMLKIAPPLQHGGPIMKNSQARQIVIDTLMSVLPAGVSPSFANIDSATETGRGDSREITAALTMFDGLPATVCLKPWAFGWSHQWMSLPGGDLSFEDGRWQRLDDDGELPLPLFKIPVSANSRDAKSIRSLTASAGTAVQQGDGS
jgi:hypothetical protein